MIVIDHESREPRRRYWLVEHQQLLPIKFIRCKQVDASSTRCKELVHARETQQAALLGPRQSHHSTPTAPMSTENHRILGTRAISQVDPIFNLPYVGLLVPGGFGFRVPTRFSCSWELGSLGPVSATASTALVLTSSHCRWSLCHRTACSHELRALC